MAQLVASASDVVLGGVAEVVGYMIGPYIPLYMIGPYILSSKLSKLP